MQNVVLVRSNPVNPDPPVEKAADALVANGFNVTIVCWDREISEKIVNDTLYLERGKAKIVRFGIPAIFGGGLKKNLKPLAIFQNRLFWWLTKHRKEYDIIHSFDFDTGFIACKIAQRYNKKLIYHILDFYVDSHQFSEGKLRNIIKKAEFNVINKADATIICTEKRKEQIQGSTPKELLVIHNTPKCVNLEPEKLSVGSNDRCKIVYVGILAGSRFLQEIISLVMQDERFELHIGGFGKMERDICEKAQKCSRITYYGKLPYEKTLALEMSCDIMTAIYDPKVPNHRFAAPNKFYESLMLGKPIIMAKNTGFDEIIKQNNIGVLIEYSEDGLKEGLELLLAQKENWMQIGERMREMYKCEYSWNTMEKRLIEYYKNL